MSIYGYKIYNFVAGSIFETNQGVRDHYDMKPAMLTNSLFKDFLNKHGLNVYKEESTRDIICIEFKYGSRSYEEESKHLEKLIKEAQTDLTLTEDQRKDKITKLEEFQVKCEQNKDKYIKYNKDALRHLFYKDGVDITWNTRNKSGKIIESETIHYKMLYRTAGKAKKGSCMFIREELYDVARNYLYMGIQLPEENAPIVEIGAYSSLVTSTIVGKIKIDPHNILILKDVDSFFTRDVVSIETNKNRECIAVRKDNYQLKNTLFDGQGLIDHSIFPDWADGYVLLRQHMCKMACFDTNLQLWFKDYYKDKYDTAEIEDMFGIKHKVKDILLVTTDNAMKWLKFNISYEYWCQKVIEDNDSMFGIVKTSHPSKLGNVQQMSYQMINALDVNKMGSIIACSVEYIRMLKTDNKAFLDYLRKNNNFSNDYDVLIALVEQDPDFIYSSYFKERRRVILTNYIKNVKIGKVINNADNLTIVGSPYAMLLYTVGEDVEKDDTFLHEDGCIQCYTGRFKDGEYLASFRNPYNSKENMLYLHNHYDDRINKYFNLGELIIAVNLLHTDFQDRANGADQDSDMVYTTNHPDIVDCARQYYKDYATIVNNIPKEKNIYHNTSYDFARVDNNLAASQIAIGGSSNLAQICLSYTYNFDDQKYKDYVCILSTLAQCAIDNAKRTFDIDLNNEISRIKSDMNISENGYPIFWKTIKEFNDSRYMKRSKTTTKKKKAFYNPELTCPMNYLYENNINISTPNSPTYSMDNFFVNYPLDMSRKKCKAVEELIEKYSWNLLSKQITNYEEDSDEYLLLRSDFDEMIKDIRSVNISGNYLGLMSWLINRAFVITPQQKGKKNKIISKLNKNKIILLQTLYTVSPKQFLKCFSKNISNMN